MSIMYPFREEKRISQVFGNKFIWNGKDYYKQFGLAGHNGTDFAVPVGTEILASFDGRAGFGDQGNKGYGKYIVITSDTRQRIYGHLSKISIKNGQLVKMGDAIGYTGNTGGSTGPHLHFGFRSLKNGKVVDANNGFSGYWPVVEKGFTFIPKKVEALKQFTEEKEKEDKEAEKERIRIENRRRGLF